MKIKTPASTKTAPAPPPPEPGTPTASAPAKCKRKCRRAPWSTCDKVLLLIVVLGFVGGLITTITLKHTVFKGEHDEHGGRGHHGWHHGGSSSSEESSEENSEESSELTTCRVAEIVEQKDVCCHRSTVDCDAGLRADLNGAEWYKFKDEAHRTIAGEDYSKEESMESFPCYKIVLYPVGRRHEDKGRHESHEGGHHGGSHGSHRRGGHRGRRDDGGHWGHGGGDHTSEEYRRWREMKEERRRQWMEAHGGEDLREHKEEQYQHHEAEEGIVVVSGQAKNGSRLATFYENTNTLEYYSQCSYSACRGGRCRDREDIESKMGKWRDRLESKASFACGFSDPNEEEPEDSPEDDEDEEGWRHHRLHHLVFIPFFALMAALLIVLVVRRCKANKAMRRTATPTPTKGPEVYMTKEEEANLPPQMTKEEEANLPPQYDVDEEANLPPSAPAVVWTTNTLPSYERASEQPPEYKSTPDMRSMTPVQEIRPEETPKDSQA